MSEVKKQVPALEDMDKERKAREEQLKKEEHEKQKEGSPDDMMVRSLHEVLDEMKKVFILLLTFRAVK